MSRAKTNRARAFTLFEMMVAVTLLSLLTLAIYATFRTGLRALKYCDRSTTVLHSGRISLELMARDLRSAFFKYEKTYDVNFQRAEERLRKQIAHDMFLMEEGQAPEMFDLYDPDRKDVFGDLNELGTPVDLSFKGTDKGDSDEVSFVRHYAGGYEPVAMTWHLGRVKYFVQGGKLFRSEDDVFRPKFDFYGEPMKKPRAPRELVARNVAVFDVSYGYWYDEEWRIDKNWDSKQKKKRNALSELSSFSYEPGSDEAQLMQYLTNTRKHVAEDGLPAFVDILLGVRTEKGGDKIAYYQTRVLMPTSQETYVPFNEGELEILAELGLGG